MPNFAARFSFSAVVLLGLSIGVASQTPPRPLRASEVLALEAGGVLPANVAHEIDVRGLNFHPDEDYRALLKTSGADVTVLAALNGAKVTAPASDGKPDKELLKQLSGAVVLIRDKRYDEAGAELSHALESSLAGPETGFVMGEVLRRKEEFRQAAEVYAEVLRQDPDFPDVHTKVSCVLYRLGASEDALHEAKTALAQNPDDAEAHKNAGLALGDQQKFDAAASEYRGRCELSLTTQACTTISASSLTTCTTTTTRLWSTRKRSDLIPMTRTLTPIWGTRTLQSGRWRRRSLSSARPRGLTLTIR